METEIIAAGKEVLLVIGALLPIVNPLGNAPIFLAMTSWGSTEMRQVLAWRIAVNAFTLHRLSYSRVLWYLCADSASRWRPAGRGGGLAAVRDSWRRIDEGRCDCLES